jgi:hypothetical protein
MKYLEKWGEEAAVVLGFFIAFHQTQAAALEVLKLFLYVGAGILGVGNLMENIRIGVPGTPAVNNTVPRTVNSDEGGKVSGPSL